MKEQAIAKINKMGKVGRIISNVMMVFLIIATVSMVAVTIILAAIPREALTLQINGGGFLNVDCGVFGIPLSQEDIDKINNGNALQDINLELKSEKVEFQFDSVEANGNVISFTSKTVGPKTIYLHDVTYIMVSILITIVMTIVTVVFARMLCKSFETCESPFEENVIIKMRNFAYSLIPWVVIKSVSESLFNSFLSGRVDVSVSLDIAMLIVVLVILALTYIFRYGAVLQQESDETL